MKTQVNLPQDNLLIPSEDIYLNRILVWIWLDYHQQAVLASPLPYKYLKA